MQASERDAWATALGVDEAEAHAALRRVWRYQEDVYAAQVQVRNQLHTVPDRDLDATLCHVERLLAHVSVVLGGTVADLAREVS